MELTADTVCMQVLVGHPAQGAHTSGALFDIIDCGDTESPCGSGCYYYWHYCYYWGPESGVMTVCKFCLMLIGLDFVRRCQELQGYPKHQVAP